MLGRHQPKNAVANKSFLGRGSSTSDSPELGRNPYFEKQQIRACCWGQGRGARWAGGWAGQSKHGFSARHTFQRDLTYAPLAPRPLTFLLTVLHSDPFSSELYSEQSLLPLSRTPLLASRIFMEFPLQTSKSLIHTHLFPQYCLLSSELIVLG